MYEPHVTRVLIELLKPGSVFMDIGANIGYFSLLTASIVGKEGKVISFEPNMQNIQLLYASLLENYSRKGTDNGLYYVHMACSQ